MSGIASRIAEMLDPENEAGAKAGFFNQTRAHAVAATWHDL